MTLLSTLLLPSFRLDEILVEYTLPEMAVGDAKFASEEDWKEAFELTSQHNSSGKIDSQIPGFYFIDVTGKYQVYFTLWRFKPVDPRIANWVKTELYMGNMATDFLSSVKKALNKIPPTVRFQIVTDQNREGLIGKNKATNQEDIKFTFGKYRGKSIGEVYLEDPRYIAWLAQNTDPQWEHTKVNQAVKVFASLYYQEVTKHNLETSKSQHYAKVGEWYQGELEIYNVTEKQGNDWATGKPITYLSYKLKDASDNKFIVYNLNKSFPEAKSGDKIHLRGKVKDHKQFLGVNFTVLNYVKPAK